MTAHTPPQPIYLDYNATTPIDPAVAEAMLPYIHEHFGNPSSSHRFGTIAKKAVAKARKQMVGMLGCRIDELIFTSGGTESNNYAIKGVAAACRHQGNHIITSAIEHPAVIEVCGYLEGQGYRVTVLPVDRFGLVDPQAVAAAITPQTILISVMQANNEVGTIQPIAEISEIARRHDVLMHTDSAQSVGKIPVDVDDLQVDLLSIAGHKIYAPKGIGALYIRRGVKLDKLMHGANHEMNLRAGTENVIEIVGLGQACELISENLATYADDLQRFRDRLERGLTEALPDITRVIGHPDRRLPNTSSICFRGLEANTILAALDTVAASAGAACHSDQVDVSSVLGAMQVPLDYAMGTIRFSGGRFTTAAEIDGAVRHVTRVVGTLQSAGGAAASVHGDDGPVRLTQTTHGLGCACKMRPALLDKILKQIRPTRDPNVLVNSDTADDAAVYRIDDHTAIVQTVDFFTPIVDDPFDFGMIAAANSLSDIYAMGARPLCALSVVGFPSQRLPLAVLEAILDGAQTKSEEAGIAIIGGHTIDDTEPKFGLAVTGLIDPSKVIKNCDAQSGDALILTKPIGTGILSTALKQSLLEENQQRQLIDTMATLNKPAADAMQIIGVNAATDVTGFGLLGHLLEMMTASQTSAIIAAGKVPLLPDTMELIVADVIPGGSRDNFQYTLDHVRYDEMVSDAQRLLLNDAQTSGGLLIAVPGDKADALIEELQRNGAAIVAVIGRVVPREDVAIRVEV